VKSYNIINESNRAYWANRPIVISQGLGDKRMSKFRPISQRRRLGPGFGGTWWAR